MQVLLAKFCEATTGIGASYRKHGSADGRGVEILLDTYALYQPT